MAIDPTKNSVQSDVSSILKPPQGSSKVPDLFVAKSYQSPTHMPPSPYGKIIILTGIVAAGKSSMTEAVRTVDTEFKEEDLDLRRDPTQPTLPSVEEKMIDDTIDRSLQGGKTVISLFDSETLMKRAAERGITDLPIKTVLLHCPFSEISSRLKTRNDAAESPGGNPSNYRDSLVAFDQFAKLYGSQAQGTESIERSQASEFYMSSFDAMVAHAKKQGNSLPPDEQVAKDKAEGCQVFLQKLGFIDDSQTHVNVAPRKAYDLVLNTSTCRDLASRVQVVADLLKIQ